MTDIQTMQRTLKLNNNKINNPILKNGQDLKKKMPRQRRNADSK